MDAKFIEIYGQHVYDEIKEYIIKNEILDIYLVMKDKVETLFDFGFHYGIPEIVAFCYCIMKYEVDIPNVVQGYYKTITADEPELIENDPLGRPMMRSGVVPIETGLSDRDGITVASIDKFTQRRKKCIEYIIRMKKFSRSTIIRDTLPKNLTKIELTCKGEFYYNNLRTNKLKFMYKIVDKYIDDYQLLSV